MIILPEEDVLKEEIDTENNIIKRNSALCNIMTPQLNTMSACYKVIPGCKCCIFSKNMHYLLLTWHDLYLKQIKGRRHYVQNRRSNKIASDSFETYNNTVKKHLCQIHNTAKYMAI